MKYNNNSNTEQGLYLYIMRVEQTKDRNNMFVALIHIYTQKLGSFQHFNISSSSNGTAIGKQ